MSTQAFDIQSLTPELQHRLTCFEADKAVYVDLQNKLVEVAQENQRLLHKATEFEGQASRTDASWKRLAGTGEIDQAKVNEEIERAEKLRKEAQAMRATVEARASLENNLILRLADARKKLVTEPRVLNKAYWQAQLEKMLARDGLREELMQIFTLSKALCIHDLELHDGVLRACNGSRQRKEKTNELVWRAFGNEFEKLFDGAEKDAPPPALATVPNALSKEVAVNSPAALHKLKTLNGKS
ncbi:hypothetical protein CYD26_06680 [Pseudomonas sp. FFUP_PS_473]|uniref:hypothetical protein n=1 Tax=Pseudomonas sp. FFUP_PS_473 TaxID=2060418 RepID=UPI000C7D6C80|nr:hypothetical protein [Pseudomonas sp. FFUP_PS_473]PLP94829.1 hypothetical protein CYD26_06680 [Pseudomonas sp. FFUP_PS_473]